MSKGIARRLALAAVALAACASAHAQDKWPSRPMRLISTSVAGGNIDVMCRIIAEKLSLRLGQPVVVDNRPGAAGKLRALAITGPQRFVAWPELATFAEQGFPGFEMPVWGGAYLPAGTPKPIVERLSRGIVEVLRSPEVSDKLIAMGQLPIGNTPEEFAENYRRDFPRWEALIKASGAKVE